MTQSIVVQIGQCGNQIGYRFWEEALKEHAIINKKGIYDEALSSFFQNVEKKTGNIIPVNDGNNKIEDLKARAVLIDMEEGVVNEIMKSPLRKIFNSKQLITDVSGAGNNWAVGYYEYGYQYKEKIANVIRKAAEECDCLQCFFCIHSMGGGTGSGVGTFVLRLLEDEYPNIYRFVTAVYPSNDDDVITSPYNSLLAMHQLTHSAECVIPIENQSLLNIISRVNSLKHSGKSCNQVSVNHLLQPSPRTKSKKRNAEKPFDEMNNIVANMLLNLTSSSRFEGSLNVDLNEISMNLVPFPKLHYLVSSMTPIYSLAGSNVSLRNLDQMFTDAFSRENQLINADPKHSLYLACSLMVRGDVEVSDIRRNIDRLKPQLSFIHWNQDGWKTGLCSFPPRNLKSSLLLLANNTCFHHTCLDLRNRFVKIYKRKAHLHHYTRVSNFEDNLFVESLESIDWLISEYERLEASVNNPVPSIARLRIA